MKKAKQYEQYEDFLATEGSSFAIGSMGEESTLKLSRFKANVKAIIFILTDGWVDGRTDERTN